MRDLARASGMSLSGIYHYVQSKDELLYQIQDRCFERVMAGGRTATRGIADPTERLAAFIRHHVTFFARHMEEMKVLSHEAESLEHRAERITERKRIYVEFLQGLLADVRPGAPPLDRAVAAYALFGMMNWIYTWYDPGRALNPEALADQFATIFLTGFVPASTTAPHGG